MDNRYFILKTDHMNLTYINVTFIGKVLRWKLYLQDKDFDLNHVPDKEEQQFVPDALSRLCMNNIQDLRGHYHLVSDLEASTTSVLDDQSRLQAYSDRTPDTGGTCGYSTHSSNCNPHKRSDHSSSARPTQLHVVCWQQ